METTFLQEGNVLVTNTRAVFGSQTYSIANITSVKFNVIDTTPSPCCSSILMLLVVVTLIWWAVTIWESSLGGGIALLVIALAAIWALVKVSNPKPECCYEVIIVSAASETSALMHKDKAYVERVHSALSAAIISRG